MAFSGNFLSGVFYLSARCRCSIFISALSVLPEDLNASVYVLFRIVGDYCWFAALGAGSRLRTMTWDSLLRIVSGRLSID